MAKNYRSGGKLRKILLVFKEILQRKMSLPLVVEQRDGKKQEVGAH